MVRRETMQTVKMSEATRGVPCHEKKNGTVAGDVGRGKCENGTSKM